MNTSDAAPRRSTRTPMPGADDGGLSFLLDGGLSWRAEANCLGLDPRTFLGFHECGATCHSEAGKLQCPESRPSVERVAVIRDAKAICAPCPVREQCLSWALENPRQQGVVGGTTLWQRDQIRDAARVAALPEETS